MTGPANVSDISTHGHPAINPDETDVAIVVELDGDELKIKGWWEMS